MRLPHFIIVGAMKSATSSLQEQLVVQPGIFMSEPKEPNFFSDDDQFARGMGWYAGLFAEAEEGALLGEASTHYTKLPTHPNAVARLKQHVPDARFVYVMRHPVDRLVSHYIHEWSMGVYNCEIEEAVGRYPELVAYGQYAMQLKPYFEAFGREAVLPVFFDRLIREPQAELERVCRFIGYPGAPIWQHDLKPSNISSERIRRFPLYGMLVESGQATWLRRNLVPQGWRDAVKERLTMKKRPELSETVRTELQFVFDRDLAELGAWLGQALDCACFKEITSTNTLNWS
ncbi:MAG TPA: sulfotransferase [Parasulfuritortus sp.]